MKNVAPEPENWFRQSCNRSAAACFHEGRSYRFALYRRWSNAPTVTFIGLNPSRADESMNDPTIRRMISFAQDLGCGSIWVVNVYPKCSPYPSALFSGRIRYKKLNRRWVECASLNSQDVVLAYGNHVKQRDHEWFIQAFPDALALKVNQNGRLAHPLYLPSGTQPMLYLSSDPYRLNCQHDEF